MSVVRMRGRPNQEPSTTGMTRVIADSLNLLRRGESFSTRKEMAAKLGITPALLNFYFGRNDFLEQPISEIIDSYVMTFNKYITLYKKGERTAFGRALIVLVEMHIQEGWVVDRYCNNIRERGLSYSAINVMKQSLANAIGDANGGASRRSNQLPHIVAAMSWSACSAAPYRRDTALCIALAKHLMILINALD